MAMNGKFYLNKAQFAPLDFSGVGRFPAFSGMDGFRNQPGCTYLKNDGAIPTGRYWIVARPVGGYRTRFRETLASVFNSNIRSQWFGLYRDDGTIDDFTFIDGVKRGNFRLHPMGPNRESKGCITMSRSTDFSMIRNMLLATSTVIIPGTDLAAYGTIEVVGYEDYCPAL
ncbi:hypothetical protein Z042_19145 [Chania multitudinisentens RB-25]|uniref:Tlde1 domain-containing protein n=1 Tax=Chania multitudinisentens RB-25 TaxID=1441930 RepID=W0LGH7_9GAMM|nr:hypothetical protein Z042_19145 [Chania multitudinisentens RB-25]